MKNVNRILKQLSESTSGPNGFDFNNRDFQFDKSNYIELDKKDLKALCKESLKQLAKEPALLEIDSPVTIVGDVHGQFYDLVHFMRLVGPCPTRSYLFLGDYVDRGNNSVETISFLLALKLTFPNHIWILRGNHESPKVSQIYGFLQECQERYDEETWTWFNKVFAYLPLAAVISSRIFCVHAGLSPDLHTLDQIAKLKKPIIIPEAGLVCDLLWSDPSTHNGYKPSSRLISYTYGEDAVRCFLNKNKLDLLCRAHQVVTEGFEFPFKESKTIITVFSAPDYGHVLKNKAAALKVNKKLECTFTVIDPNKKTNPAKLHKYPISEKAFHDVSKAAGSGLFKHKSKKKK